ncbi:hypothetical protein F52700_2458 [Fusarium sp. NRRL 52700]|nr:hypothetical protein F52700_2458 [Fusarium sp. NRRL 52700]
MPSLTDQELRTLHNRIKHLESDLKLAKKYAAVLESNLATARKTDLNTGNPGGAAGDLKEGETRLVMIETDKGRFVKMTMGPVFFPASEMAEKMGTDVDSLWAANGPGGSKVR